MKKNEIKQEFLQLDAQELARKIENLRQELFNYRLNASTAHIKDYSQFKKLRKQIARGLTYLRNKQA